MEVTFKIKRSGVQSDGKATEQSYVLDVDPETSVFDALVRIREEQDGSLAFRGACRSGFCGDCTLACGRDEIISCLVPVGEVAKEGEVPLEPLKNARVIKDLLTDWNRFLWDKYKSIHPWIASNGAPSEAVTDEALEPVRMAMRCTMCGQCDDGCTVIDIDKDFLGPAALTKLYRLVRDPRDTETERRFREAGERRGLWDCVHCWEASEHCPWGINPSHLIMDMRDQSIALGIKSGQGNKVVARHYDAFVKSVRDSGWLDERALVSKTYGLPPYGFSPSAIISQVPIAIKALRRGKASLMPHPKRAGYKEIARIFERQDQKKKRQSKSKREDES